MSGDLLEIEGLSVEPRSNPVQELLIEGFGLRLAAGQAVGLVGETGAGKSLSMRASVGLLPDAIGAVAGHVAFRGVRIPATDKARLRANLGHGICLLLQNGRGALNPFMRVSAQVERILRYRGVPRRLRAGMSAELLDSVGLPAGEFGGRYAHQLSGGQAQRVAIVIALATEPQLLIADEPTTALDVTTERDVIGLLKRLCKDRDMGLVLITHNLGLVANNCDSAVIMHAGHVVESGPTGAIFQQPSHPYTQALLRAIPDVDSPQELVPLAGSVPARGSMGCGCRFVERCPDHLARCRASVPPLYPVDGQLARCFLREPASAALVSE